MENKCWLRDQCKRAECPEEFCIKQFKLDFLYKEALLKNNQRQYIALRPDADGTDRDQFAELKEIQSNIESFVNSGSNLYIHSRNCGTGKTSWAIRMIQAYFNSIWHTTDLKCRALFINVPRFFLALKDNLSQNNEYAQHIKDKVADADLVVWDEVGTKSLTTFEFENLLSLIDLRISEGKSNIYTSNLSSEDLKEVVGDRLYSRIVNLSKDIEFHGQDKRGY